MKLGERKFGAARCKVNRTTSIPEHMRDRVREITSVYVPAEQRNQGHATKLMHQLCNEADEAGYVLLLSAKAYGDGDMDDSQLTQWYARTFGFAVIQAEPLLLARMAGSTPRLSLKPTAQALN